MNEKEICGECRHHCIDREGQDWVCTNPDSDYEGDYTGYEDGCPEWEARI